MDNFVLIPQMKNDRTSLYLYCVYFFILFREVIVVVLDVVVVVVVIVCRKICGNTSPENWGRYHLMNDFNCLSFYDVVPVFTNLWIIDVPSLEIDINIVIANSLRGWRCRWRRGCRWLRRWRCRECRSHFPFWKNKLFWFDDDFRNFA